MRRSVSFLVARLSFLSWRSSASGPRSSSGSSGVSAASSNTSRKIGFSRFNALAHPNHEIEHDRRAQHFFFDFVLAGLDALGDFDFLLPRQKLEVAHLLEIEPHRVRRLAQRIGSRRRSLGRFFGLFLGFDLDFVGALGRDFLEHLDIKVLEAVERGAQVGGRGDILRQEVVDLLEGQVALLAPEIDKTL